MSRTFKIILEKEAEGGFSVNVPSLPGCCTQGETIEELNDNLIEVIELLLEDGEPELEAEFVGTQALRVG
jgi:predicted RNase H-like HicB family nuclease